jgi:hypothetical protein
VGPAKRTHSAIRYGVRRRSPAAATKARRPSMKRLPLLDTTLHLWHQKSIGWRQYGLLFVPALPGLARRHPCSALAWLFPMRHQPEATTTTRADSRATRVLAIATKGRAPLGLGSGDRFKAFRGCSGVFRGGGAATGENGRIAGKALYQARFPDHVGAGRNLHGKEAVPGSSPGEGLNTCKSAVFVD